MTLKFVKKALRIYESEIPKFVVFGSHLKHMFIILKNHTCVNKNKLIEGNIQILKSRKYFIFINIIKIFISV